MKIIDTFKIIGVEIETTNESGKAAEDLGNLWVRFYTENISNQISNKTSEDVYSIYTDYESDYKGKYKTIIGQKIDSLNKIPSGLIGREFKGGNYKKYIAKGEMPKAVAEKWRQIWAKDEELNRKYTYDLEVYGKNSHNGENSGVEIYIAVQ